MNATDAAGNSAPVSGLVQYATMKDGEVLVSINDKYYPAADLDSIVDYDYYLYLREHADEMNIDVGQDKPEEGSEQAGTEGRV